MRGLDGQQFGDAVEEGEVAGGQRAAGHQLVERATEVHHHLAAGVLLVAVGRQLGHQNVHRALGWGGTKVRSLGPEKDMAYMSGQRVREADPSGGWYFLTFTFTFRAFSRCFYPERLPISTFDRRK